MPQEFSRTARLFTALAGFMVLAACGGGGGSIDTGNPGGGNPPPGGGTNITISGRITFDRLQFQPTVGQGLNAANPVESPAREVVVEAVANGSTVASTTTDANGDYSFSVPANTNMSIRARARMEKTGAAPTWSFTIRNNTNSDAVYALQGDTFNSGAVNLTRNLRATSGWGGTSYTGTRAAAPFAILDTVYRTKQLILGAAPAAQFPELNLYWSDQNRPDDGSVTWRFCPDTGDIGTSFYFRDPSGTATDDCTQATPLPAGIYILGAFATNGDTDEFDQHVIAHEFGHYFEDRFSRSDSIGGQHGGGDQLDLRVAFGEGWGNAFGAMALGDPQYRDSSRGISQDGGFNLESDDGAPEGWFSEFSVGEILWDIFDTAAEPGDTVTLGFAPIYSVMAGPQVDTDALTSIFSFASALRSANGSSSGAIQNLLDNEDINGTGAFGTSETNGGTDPGFANAGVYRDIFVGTPIPEICTTSSASGNDGNKLGNRRFLRFQKNTAGSVNILATGVTGSLLGSGMAEDPDILVHVRGIPQSFGTGNDGLPIGQSGESRRESMTVVLAAGTYVLEVYDFQTIDPEVRPQDRPTTPRCMTLSISGTP